MEYEEPCKAELEDLEKQSGDPKEGDNGNE